ncbi:hypothetical protein NQ314_014155 [Rhamnusium bicolor]|uniref:Uncharacterized protein n=1 Tax=Rhamnusium bicolor TaxID=1586634 RepID=A0AAV8X3G4_9CUCU|nr:hypothetical protein NQ314_014155 [Rhamnusium bicolor]
MDPETGEYYADSETGETSYSSSSSSSSSFNVETGEYEGDNCLPRRRFRVPSSCYTPTQKKDGSKKLLKVDKQEWELITAAIFLLPTMILFYPVLSVFALMLEIFLHTWSHKKNKTLKCDNIYYQSPLHGIAKEFCGRCKFEDAKVKITKIQDIRNDKLRKYGLEYIRRVVT